MDRSNPQEKDRPNPIPNSVFRKMVETFTLESIPEGTLASVTTEYEPKGLLWKIMDLLFMRRSIGKSYAATLSNAKALIVTPDIVTH